MAVGGVSIFSDSDEYVGIVDTMEVSAFIGSKREPCTTPSPPVASSITGATRDDQDSSKVSNQYYFSFV